MNFKISIREDKPKGFRLFIPAYDANGVIMLAAILQRWLFG